MTLKKLLPGTKQILEFFNQEIPAIGGQVTDAYENGNLLYLRSILPDVLEVRPRDGMQGGLAARVTGPRIEVDFYLFRQVCRNGAIMTHMLQERIIERVKPTEFTDPEDAVEPIMAELREAVHACGTPEALVEAVDQVRSTLAAPADSMERLMPMLAALPVETAVMIMARFAAERDQSTFSLMNAVTSVARDTPDPELRWRLEELGGGIPARLRPGLKPDRGAVMAMRA